jgi:hypothetical protein
MSGAGFITKTSKLRQRYEDSIVPDVLPVRPGRVLLLITALLGLTLSAPAQITVTVERNIGADATKSFKFKNFRPLKDDAAAKATLTLLSGEVGSDLSALTDGVVPTKEDDPKANFSFANGSSGGRFRIDLGEAVEISQINTYSWHSGARASQVYRLYGSDGAELNFCAEPKSGVTPSNCGWKVITTVDTRRNGGDGGGQYVAGISDARGSLGRYRYLLFDCWAVENDDDFGNTFYSEIDVIAKK